MAKTRDALSVENGPARRGGLRVSRLFTDKGTHPYDELTWERRDAVITNWRDGTTASSSVIWSSPPLVAERHQHRGPEVLPRPLGTPQREHSDARWWTGSRYHHALGRKDGYFAPTRRESFQSELTHLLVNQKALQLPGLVQRRRRARPAVLGLLHPVGRGHHAVDPQLVRRGGHDLQGRVGVGHQPVDHPLVQGAAGQRRRGIRPGVVHARGRRLGRDHQVGRQDPAGGQDGRAQRRPPRRARLHLVQGP